MAKHRESKRKHESGQTITTPSHFGSHSKMVLDSGRFSSCHLFDGIVLQDDTGLYITKEARLDTGLADPNRYSYEKREKDIVKYGLKINES
jgi:hypothetical protein